MENFKVGRIVENFCGNPLSIFAVVCLYYASILCKEQHRIG